MRTFKVRGCRRIHGLRYSPDGDQLLVLGGVEPGGPDSAVCVDPATGEMIRSLSCSVDSYAFTRDATRLVLGTSVDSRATMQYLVRWWNPWEGSVDWHSVKVTSAWPTGTHVAASVIVAVNGPGDRIIVAFGRQRFAPGSNSAQWTHHLADCRLDGSVPPKLVDIDSQVLSVAVSPDEKRFATSVGIGVPPTIYLRESQKGPPVAEYRPKGSKNPAAQLTFSPDGRFLAAISGRTIPLLSEDRLEPLAVLEGHSKQVNAIAFSPDSRRLASASHDGAIRIWDTATGRPVSAFDWKIGPLTAVAFAPDGLTCAAAGAKGPVVIWDVDD